jgi:4-hydroxy-3-polyprenylbenzoate decarboxylase
MAKSKRIIVGISGASGSIYGLRLLEKLRAQDVELHLVISKGAKMTLPETGKTLKDVEQLADVVHHEDNFGATISSGSFKTDGMIVAPCSMRSLAAIAHGAPYNLLTRAADVVLKERRRLVLLTRETPLTLAHIRNMESVTLMGGVIYPPIPAFYHQPKDINELVDFTLSRALDLFGFDDPAIKRWEGL